MTLDEAIEHARDEACRKLTDSSTASVGLDYLQIAKWLEELKLYKSAYSAPPKISNDFI